jgi:co-chaperonin GroES (HSP10)
MFERLSDIPKKTFNFDYEEGSPMPIQPHGDLVLMEMTKEECVTPGGLVIPYSAQVKQWQGKVIAKGKGKYCDQIEVGHTYAIEPMFERKDGKGTDGVELDKNQMLVEADLLVAEIEQ